MARRGREFELLIEKLEKAALQKDATISSPGRIRDRITNRSREVDILIEYKIGTTPISIIIECRKRGSTQDTTWIEQLKTKVSDLRANKVIAVSSSKFSDEAIKKAKFYGIETRTYSEIDYDVIKSWWQAEFLDVLTRHYTLVSTYFDVENPKINFDFSDKGPRDKFINRTRDNQLVSPNDIFEGFIDRLSEWESMKPNDPPIRKNMNITFTNQEDRYYLTDGKERTDILKVSFVADIQNLTRQVPISTISEYSNEQGKISTVIEYHDVKLGDNNVLQLIHNPDGSISISSRKKDGD